MGRATISGGGEDGLYTAAVQYETKWVDTMREANEDEIEKLEEQITEVNVHIAETDLKIDAKKIALGQLLEIYKAIVAALNWQPPTHPDADSGGDSGLPDFSYEGSSGGDNSWVSVISEHWAPEKSYSKGDRIIPTWGGGSHHLCLEDGVSGAIEPTWASGRDAYTIDGSVAWTCVHGLWVTQDVDIPDGPTTTSTGLSGWEVTTDMHKDNPVPTVLAPHSPPDMDPVLRAFSYLMRALVEVKAWRDRKESYERYKSFLEFQIEALEKKNAEMADAIEEPAPQSMWCADLTEDLAGEVDTIEVKGAPDQILIGPAGAVGFAGSKLANVLAMSSAQAGLAWALLPGWQKWRPTYRVGTIHSINYDANTASVTLDAAASIAQGLDVNQSLELEAIPVDYMTCDAAAFENDDRVVVEFPGQVWGTGPTVIGFETNPQPCRLPVACFDLQSTTSIMAGFYVCESLEWGPDIFLPIDPARPHLTSNYRLLHADGNPNQFPYSEGHGIEPLLLISTADVGWSDTYSSSSNNDTGSWSPGIDLAGYPSWMSHLNCVGSLGNCFEEVAFPAPFTGSYAADGFQTTNSQCVAPYIPHCDSCAGSPYIWGESQSRTRVQTSSGSGNITFLGNVIKQNSGSTVMTINSTMSGHGCSSQSTRTEVGTYEDSYDHASAVVRGVDGYADDQTWMAFWTEYSSEWSLSDTISPWIWLPHSNTFPAAGPVTTHQTYWVWIHTPGWGIKMEYAPAGSWTSTGGGSMDDVYPYAYHIYDFDGEPVFVFSFYDMRSDTFQYGSAYQGEIHFSEAFPYDGQYLHDVGDLVATGGARGRGRCSAVASGRGQPEGGS